MWSCEFLAFTSSFSTATGEQTICIFYIYFLSLNILNLESAQFKYQYQDYQHLNSENRAIDIKTVGREAPIDPFCLSMSKKPNNWKKIATTLLNVNCKSQGNVDTLILTL